MKNSLWTATTLVLTLVMVAWAGVAFANAVEAPECDEFPPAGFHTMDPTEATVTISLPLLGLTDVLVLSGPSEVQRGHPIDPGDGRREIPTEIVSMDLTGASAVLGPLLLVESPLLASLGHIKAQSPASDFPADSFFNVFFEIETFLPPPLDLLHNEDPLRTTMVIDCIPPVGAISAPAEDQVIALYDVAGNEVGVLIFGQQPSPPCDVNGDHQIDRNDIAAIFAARNTTASGPNDPSDANGDGLITVNDGRLCVLECDLPRCAVP